MWIPEFPSKFSGLKKWVSLRVPVLVIYSCLRNYSKIKQVRVVNTYYFIVLVSWESGWSSLGPLAQRLSIQVSAGTAVSSEGLSEGALLPGWLTGLLAGLSSSQVLGLRKSVPCFMSLFLVLWASHTMAACFLGEQVKEPETRQNQRLFKSYLPQPLVWTWQSQVGQDTKPPPLWQEKGERGWELLFLPVRSLVVKVLCYVV